MRTHGLIENRWQYPRQYDWRRMPLQRTPDRSPRESLRRLLAWTITPLAFISVVGVLLSIGG
jgi:hypothetical protein